MMTNRPNAYQIHVSLDICDLTGSRTANARPAGTYQADALQNIIGHIARIVGEPSAGITTSGAFSIESRGSAVSITGGSVGTWNVLFNAGAAARTSTETRGPSTAVAPVILI